MKLSIFTASLVGATLVTAPAFADTPEVEDEVLIASMVADHAEDAEDGDMDVTDEESALADEDMILDSTPETITIPVSAAEEQQASQNVDNAERAAMQEERERHQEAMEEEREAHKDEMKTRNEAHKDEMKARKEERKAEKEARKAERKAKKDERKARKDAEKDDDGDKEDDR